MEKGKREREREREREFTRYITRRRNRTSRAHQSYRVASCFLSVSRKTSGARFCARAKACLCLKKTCFLFFFFGSSFTREVFDFADDGRRRPFGCLPRFSKKRKRIKNTSSTTTIIHKTSLGCALYPSAITTTTMGAGGGGGGESSGRATRSSTRARGAGQTSRKSPSATSKEKKKKENTKNK